MQPRNGALRHRNTAAQRLLNESQRFDPLVRRLAKLACANCTEDGQCETEQYADDRGRKDDEDHEVGSWARWTEPTDTEGRAWAPVV